MTSKFKFFLVVLLFFLSLFGGSIFKKQFIVIAADCFPGNNCASMGSSCIDINGSPCCTNVLLGYPSNCTIPSCSCAGGGCFPPGTIVKTPTGGTPIQSIKKGDSVTSFNDQTNKIVNSNVSNIYEVQRTFYFSIIAGGYHVTVTAEHPFFVGNGKYKEAQDLKTGDVLYVDQNNILIPVVIAANIRIDEPTSAYNLTVDNSHTFFANDFAVHNKCTCDGCYYGGACIGNMYNIISFNIHFNSPPTSATINWGQDAGGRCSSGGAVVIFMGTNQANVNNNCGLTPSEAGGVYNYTNTNGCWVFNAPYYNATCIDNKQGTCNWQYTDYYSYTTPNVLSTNTVYYTKVISLYDGNKQGGPAYCSSPPAQTNVSCSVQPSTAAVDAKQSLTLSTTVNSSSPVTNVIYSGDANYTSFNPYQTTISPYQTVMTALKQTSPGTTTVTSTIVVSGLSYQCTGATITINPQSTSQAWWQVNNGDVGTNGNLNSEIPTGQVFETILAGEYPGIPSYWPNTNIVSPVISVTGWIAKSPITNPRTFDSKYFANQIPADTVITTLNSNVLDQAAIDANVTPSYGYYWYKYDGQASGLDLNVNSNIDLAGKKVVLLVTSANFNINANINLTDGQGFFLVSVGVDGNGNKGNIFVNPSVGSADLNLFNLEGLYEADGQFYSGTGGTSTDNFLTIRGSVVAYGGFVLQRDLGPVPNFANPAEYFRYAADQVMMFPKVLSFRKINWKEVAP